MADNRPICIKCSLETGKVVRLINEKSGVVVPYSSHGYRRGDLYQCSICGRGIVIGFGDPVYAPREHIQQVLEDKKTNIIYGVTDE